MQMMSGRVLLFEGGQNRRVPFDEPECRPRQVGSTPWLPPKLLQSIQMVQQHLALMTGIERALWPTCPGVGHILSTTSVQS